MEPLGSISEDLIGSATSVQAIVDALARHGCLNLTPSIQLATCSEYPLAGGGFCDVFRGTLYWGTTIAIKCLRVYNGSEAEGDSEKRKILKRAARERYHWSKLQHCNVLPLMGLAIFRGHIAMVSEWMGNGNLMAYLRLNPGADRSRICIDVCEGLCYIHANGMVHGDLKAANVMVSAEGTALIADFGNAQLKDLTLKFTNTTKGGLSVRWAAPELLLEEGAPQSTKEADVYAYGMIMLEVMTGKVPFEGTGDNRVIYLVAYEQKVPPRPDIGMDGDLWSIMNLCWTREAPKRPQITTVKHRLQGLFAAPILPPISKPPGLSIEIPPVFWPRFVQHGTEGNQSLPSTSSTGSATGILPCVHIRARGPGESFGVPLMDQLVRDGTEQPKALTKCAEAIEKHGSHTFGIYTLTARTSRVVALRGLLNRNMDAVNLDSSEWAKNILTVASVLKRWVHELPEPLMTWELYDSFIDAAQIQSEWMRAIRLHEHVNALPNANYSTLKYLMGHLYRVSEWEHANQMSRSNLARVFGPLLLRPRGEDKEPLASLRALQDMSWRCNVIKEILDKYAFVFVE